MSRLLKIVIGILVLLVVLVALLPMLIQKERLLAFASEKLRQETGATLTVDGAIELSLFPRLALDMRDARLSMPEGGPTLRAGLLRTGVAVMPLLSSRVEIDRIQIDDLFVTTTTDSEAAARAAAAASTVGLSNAELDALYAARRAARQQTSGQGAALAAPLALNVGELAVNNATLKTVDTGGKTLSEITVVELTASGLNTTGQSVPMSGLLRIPSGAGSADIGIAFDGSIATDLSTRSLNLEQLELTVLGATRSPLKASLAGTFDLEEQVADIKLSFSVEETRGEGVLRYATFASPQIDATLALNTFTPALLALAGPEAAGSEIAPVAAGQPTPLPYDALRAIDSAAQLTIDRVELGVHTLSMVSASLRAVDGDVVLSDVTGELHGGQIDFSARLNAHYSPATLRSKGSLSDLDISSLVTALESTVEAGGSATLTWDVESLGDDSRELTQALTGPVTLRSKDVTLRNIAVEETFCRAVALANRESLSEEFPDDTRFSALEADIALGGGVARLNPLSARLEAITLTGTGSLDLLKQDFNAVIKAQLQEALGEKDPACRIDERYTDLRWPVECKGNLADEDPSGWCKLDTESIVKDLAEGEAKRKVKKEANKLLKKLFDSN